MHNSGKERSTYRVSIKHGIRPDIYEKRSQVGDRFVNGEVMLNLLTRPVQDCIASLSDKYGIYLKPLSPVAAMRIYSRSRQADIHAPLGFVNIRGRHKDAFEMQLAQQVTSPIRFHSDVSLEQLQREYTHVIVATGDGDYAQQARNFRTDLSVSIKGAMVEGHFDRYTVMTWLDYDLAPYGYGYLIPLSERQANLSLGIPDIEANLHTSTDALWDSFIRRVRRDLGQELPVTDSFQITRYPMGICQRARIGNTFFAGNCFGAMMPFLGFGQFAALLTGVYAAWDLLGKGDYEQLTQSLRRSYDHSLVLRRAMEQLDNDALDRIIQLLGGPLGDRLFQTRRLNILPLISYLLKPWIRLKQNQPLR